MATEEKVNILDEFKVKHEKNEIDTSKKLKVGIIGTGWIADAHMEEYLKMPDIEFVGAITEALAYYSHQYVRDALYNTVLKYRDAKDAESSKCIDIILANPKYDFVYIYAGAWGDMQGPASILRNCIGAGSDSVASYFDQFKSKYTTKLADFLENFQ